MRSAIADDDIQATSNGRATTNVPSECQAVASANISAKIRQARNRRWVTLLPLERPKILHRFRSRRPLQQSAMGDE